MPLIILHYYQDIGALQWKHAFDDYMTPLTNIQSDRIVGFKCGTISPKMRKNVLVGPPHDPNRLTGHKLKNSLQIQANYGRAGLAHVCFYHLVNCRGHRCNLP